MDDTDLRGATEFAWACGLFEGEGCIHAGRKGRRGEPRSQRRLCLTMTDQETVARFAAAVGVGEIDEHTRPAKATEYQWRLYRTDDVLDLLARMTPMLGQRRNAQANALREAI